MYHFKAKRGLRGPALYLALALLLPLLAGCVQSSEVITSPTATAVPTMLATTLASGPLAGSTQMSPAEGMIMVFVPAGEFDMGSEIGLTDEQPVHTVYLDAFWIDQTEVSNVQYAKCVATGACDLPSVTVYHNDPNYANHPVAFVSWNKAQDYCAWTGRRLPTEAEWEKAATWNQATNEKFVYPWGNEFECKKANFDDEVDLDATLMPGSTENCEGYVRSAPVGSFPGGASPYGAMDMAGNVWEWVHDAFIETDPLTASIQNYYAVSPASNPQGVDPAITDYRGMRGGSWDWTFGYGRSAYRLWYGLDDSYDNVGFRCAQSH
jgi:formylglycine-generating enzyme required for sulfatase activity